MKLCSLCERRHHAKGFCKTHYRHFILKKRLIGTVCSVVDCNNAIADKYTKKGLCEKHGTRLVRHGNVNFRTRAREIASFANLLKDCDDPFNFEIKSRISWSGIAKAVYGNKCMRCGWDEGTCDAHHKTPVKEGGKNTVANAEIICPNCHRLEHQNSANYFSDETKAFIKSLFM